MISGPSGVGKTTIVHALLAELDDLVRSVSYTTRPKRPHEICGKDYHFIPEARFKQLIRQGEFLEHARVFGHYYGTSRREIKELLSSGKCVIKEVDVQGAETLRRPGRSLKIPRPIFIFLLPPSLEELTRRLAGRATEGEAQRRARLRTAERELAEAPKFDHVIINRSVSQVVAQIKEIILRVRNGA